MVNFGTRIPGCDSHSPAPLDLFISCDANICSTIAFPPLGNSDRVVVSVYLDFTSHSQCDAPFHHIFCDYPRADWDSLHDNLRDIPWEDIFKLRASAAASEFGSGFRLKMMYMYLIESIRSSLTHLHDFQLLVLLPQFIEITFFVPKG